MFDKAADSIGISPRCGIILAAGEGKRLQPFIERLRGDSIPKQYVNIIGKRSMLEHTLCRARKLIPSERLFTVVSENHLRYPEVKRQLRQSRRARRRTTRQQGNGPRPTPAARTPVQTLS